MFFGVFLLTQSLTQNFPEAHYRLSSTPLTRSCAPVQILASFNLSTNNYPAQNPA